MTESAPTPNTNARSASETAHPPVEHPKVDDWILYHRGELDPERRERMQAHLTRCRRCVDLVLDLDAFDDPGAETPEVADFERAAVWRALAPRLEKPRRRLPTALAAAAMAILAIPALFGLVYQQREMDALEERLAELASPRPNAVIRDLFPRSGQRGGGDETGALPRDRGPVTLILHLAEPAADAGYRLELVDAAGREVWSGPGLKPTPFGSFTLTLPVAALPGGRYELRLYAGEELVERYPLELEG